MKATGLALVAVIAVGAGSSVLAQGAAAVKVDKAGLAAEIKNDQRVVLVPGAGRRFLWVTATASGAAQSLDLTKVVLAAGSETLPLIGVDSAWGGAETFRTGQISGLGAKPIPLPALTADVRP